VVDSNAGTRRTRKGAANPSTPWSKRLISAAIAAFAALLVYQAFWGGTPALDGTIVVAADEIDRNREAAGCEVYAKREPLPVAYHVREAAEIDADVEYFHTRPTHSGPHTDGTHPVVSSASNQIPEESSTHNLEHGAIITWYDPEQVDRATVSAMGTFAAQLNDAGMADPLPGVGLMTSPYEEPGIDSGKAVAFRAWGTAMDCDTWDQEVAEAFVLRNYGEAGIAPEAFLAGPVPDDVLVYDELPEELPAGPGQAPDGTPLEPELDPTHEGPGPVMPGAGNGS